MLSYCKLCGKFRPLHDSHVLPEFVYRPAYDLSHTAIKLDLDHNKKLKRQRGFTERLLCKDCEIHISRWETYFARIWFDNLNSLRPKMLTNNVVIIARIDYAPFKLFHLSLIWRAGVSSRYEFKNIRLGAQEPKIRKLILAEDPGAPEDYAFFGIALRKPDTKTFQDKLLSAPAASRVNGHWVYTLIFGGVLWHYWVSGHTDGRLVPYIFGRDGKLTLAVQDWTKNIFIRAMAREIVERQQS